MTQPMLTAVHTPDLTLAPDQEGVSAIWQGRQGRQGTSGEN